MNGQYLVPAQMSAHEKNRLDLAERCSMSPMGIERAFQCPIAVVESDRNPIFALKLGPLVGNFAVAGQPQSYFLFAWGFGR